MIISFYANVNGKGEENIYSVSFRTPARNDDVVTSRVQGMLDTCRFSTREGVHYATNWKGQLSNPIRVVVQK